MYHPNHDFFLKVEGGLNSLGNRHKPELCRHRMNGHPTDLCPALNRPSSTTLDFPKTYSLSAANISKISFPISAASHSPRPSSIYIGYTF